VASAELRRLRALVTGASKSIGLAVFAEIPGSGTSLAALVGQRAFAGRIDRYASAAIAASTG